MNIKAVIGANYGDEGKDLITDYLATPQTLVVRHNGGCQAGHTVVTPEGRRYVFRHHGAGTFRGAPTLLAQKFIVNPFTFVEEGDELRDRFGLEPDVILDPWAVVTTPYDIQINRAIERARGGCRHGSCGMGINETVTRSLDPTYTLYAWELLDARSVRARLRGIAQEWVPARLDALGLTLDQMDPVENWLLDAYEHAGLTTISRCSLAADDKVVRETPSVVFEGAQGLWLDEFSPDFPHVTRSRTGLTNVVDLLQRAKREHEAVDVHYVTRAYLTRHGAGPLPGEVAGHPYGWVGPETNVTGDWQGSFRYAPLDPARVHEGITRDLAGVSFPGELRPRLAVTCLDQLPTPEARLRLLVQLSMANAAPLWLLSTGPTRDHVLTSASAEDLWTTVRCAS